MADTCRQTLGDPSSSANIEDVLTKHLVFDWRVDFELKEIQGSATLKMEVKKACSTIVLDTRSLKIHNVTVDGTVCQWKLGESSDAFGQKMTITSLGKEGWATGQAITVCISYQTDPGCTALAWLPKEQTDGKTHPYLFSQCQAIHARSLFPCQDTPGVRATYEATVTVPGDGLIALMSALLTEKREENGCTITKFSQPVSLASYLVAIVVGNLVKRDVSARVAVWSEPNVVDRAAHDFSDAERFVSIGEDLVGPYVWGRYDVVCLPGSFPYGGMENPCLTFVTPSLLTGDKSLADVICHEAAHSWTGNLVGPKTWEDFYLNEGFTMFLQRKIMVRLHGRDFFDFDGILGWEDLKVAVERIGSEHPNTVLRPNLKDVDPDDAFSIVPYEKGFNFICYLQKVVGDEPAFEAWLKDYIQTFAHQAITTNDMVLHLVQYFSEERDGRPKVDFSSVNWSSWLDAPGMPPTIPGFSSSIFDQCVELCERWKKNDPSLSEDDIKGWTCQAICCFLTKLESPIPTDVITRMDALYHFNSSTNSEILFLWYLMCIRNEWSGHEEGLKGFLSRIGRMKFTRPLYRALKEKHPEQAAAIFKENESRYHAIGAKMIRQDLDLR